MSKPLPTREFKWMNEEELEDWRSFSCILEVDLEYPDRLHYLHNGYPLAPERVTVNKVDKLIPNLRNKKKYVVHYENLKLYERLKKERIVWRKCPPLVSVIIRSVIAYN